MRNLYETLELHKGASAQDIKRSYHRLAHQFHPDKNPGDKAAEERFKEASRAYDILSDAKMRSRYDRFGPAGVGLGGEAGFPGAEFAQNFSESVGDLFQEIFGRHRTKRQAPATKPPPPARQLTLQVDLLTCVQGGHVPLQLVRHERCTPCVGTGATPGSSPQLCTQCSGTGSLRVQQGVFSIGKRCPSCQGQGRLTADKCASCQGQGFFDRNATLKVRVPKGAQSGTALRLKAEGEPGPGGVQGDLLVTLRVVDHPRFTQHELDLCCTWPVTMVEAALGSDIRVPFIDGTCIDVTVPQGCQHGDVIEVPHKGACRLGSATRGSLRITVHIEVPRALSQAAKTHLLALCGLASEAHYPKRAQAERSFKAPPLAPDPASASPQPK